MNQDFGKKTILMIDDNTINYEMVSVMIGDVYNLKFATDGLRGLSVLKENSDISLILLDLIMPNMNGVEFLIKVKKNPKYKDIPVIVMTTSEDSEAECLSLGAIDFIKKPFPLRSVLLARIENALNSTKEVTGYEFDSYINTLFSDYQTVYLIDINTSAYEAMSTDEDFLSLGLSANGDNFFGALASEAAASVYAQDCQNVVDSLSKDRLMAALQSHHGFTMDYRLNIGNEPKHYRLKAMLVPDENPQIIIGITSTEEQVVEMEKLKTMRDSTHTFIDVAQSLASDYICIYCVHLASERFIEFSSDGEYDKLGIEKSGTGFFTLCLKNILRVVHPDDLAKVMPVFTKDNIVAAIDDKKAFTLTYRLMLEAAPAKVMLKATRLITDGEEYAVFGVSKID